MPPPGTSLPNAGPDVLQIVAHSGQFRRTDGGVMAGLGRQVALELATQTVLGTAKMVQETGTHPAILREQVTSPGGTTIAALSSMERAGFRSAVIDGVIAAVKRSRELAG